MCSASNAALHEMLWYISDVAICQRCSLCLQVAFYLVDLLQDANTEVVKAADQALAVISETDEEWAAKLRALKFEAHNQAWLEACASSSTQQVHPHATNIQVMIIVETLSSS